MDGKAIFEFLIDLQFNNNRIWFSENQEQYEFVRSEFEQYINQLIPKLRQFDDSIDVSSAKECMFRFHRDIRFSKNKEPYKTNFGAYLAKGGRKSPYAGYYIHLEPDNSFIGGGIYMPEPEILKKIRTGIYNDPQTYKNIIHAPDFKQYFPEIYGDKLKTAPKGFPKDFPDIDLLRNRHYVVTHPVDHDFWSKQDVLDQVIAVFKVQHELNLYLNQIIINY